MKRSSLSVLLMASLAACSDSAEPAVDVTPEALSSAAGTITAEDYFQRLSVIANDSMLGRDTPSPGLEATANWIAAEFERFGIEPAGEEGTYFQRYPLTSVRADFGGSSAAMGGTELSFGKDLSFPSGAVEGDLEGDVMVVSGSGMPDEQQLTQAVGKHVLIIAKGGGGRRAGFRTIRSFQSSGALSVVQASASDDTAWDRAVERQRTNVGVRFGTSTRAPRVNIRDAALRPILSARGLNLDSLRSATGGLTAKVVPGLRLSLTLRAEMIQEQTAPNVVGMLEGRDPELRDEFVVFSAHMDHIGTGTPDESGDSIFNGADDDASGTVTIVELAEAFASMDSAPRRSTIFLLVSGEEKGLWGSRYFVDNPPVPIDRIVADLNADMVGRNWPDSIVVIGKEHSDLGATLKGVNDQHPELGMVTADDIWPEQNFYSRSDHYNFARKGVPILFFFNGTHDDYHGRNDEVDRIDSEKASRIGKLMFYLGVEVADRTARPVWNPESYREIVEGVGR
ncbi:MAG: M20/M25/M40 family metallo-hydrolase [Gemmatimonadota bacterium]|nr:MAG: M20/M25/M40 family metallo-hydrolase [Gemmatimonadota bacterium]